MTGSPAELAGRAQRSDPSAIAAQPASVRAALRSIAWQPWTEWLSHQPAGHTWLWFDLDGIQASDALPAQAPLATHLWGWLSGRSWVRLRIDDDQLVGAHLTADAAADLAAQRIPACRWAGGEGRVDPQWGADALVRVRSEDLVLVRTPPPNPLTFVEVAR